jgi:hypothetical protein
MAESGAAEPAWLEPVALRRLVERAASVRGDEPPEDAIMREPNLLIPVSAPGTSPLDVHTYRVRRDRWEAGDGPRITGMREFVETLETLSTPSRAAIVKGRRTTYTFLLDAALERVIGSVAADVPPEVHTQPTDEGLPHIGMREAQYKRDITTTG